MWEEGCINETIKLRNIKENTVKLVEEMALILIDYVGAYFYLVFRILISIVPN